MPRKDVRLTAAIAKYWYKGGDISCLEAVFLRCILTEGLFWYARRLPTEQRLKILVDVDALFARRRSSP